MANPLEGIGQRARNAARILAQATEAQKNAALDAIIAALQDRAPVLLSANEKDVAAAKAKNIEDAMLDRLRLTGKRLQGMVDGIAAIRALPDPVELLLDSTTRPNGLKIEKRSVPIGVIGIIFESRPNVTVDAAALCLKSGNACILRGGSDSWQSAQALIEAMQSGLKQAGLPVDAVQTLPSADRELVGAMLTLDQHIDLIIPRGGKSLTARVRAESKIPVLSHLEGVCHTYIDAKADAKKAVAITVNAKMRRTSVCGATECLLLHRSIARTLGGDVLVALLDAGCQVRVPDDLLALDERLKRAMPADYGHEFLAPIIAVAIADNVKDAVEFIDLNGSQHTDAIITEDAEAAAYFLRHVNSAIAIHNASTQFADGGEFGKGAEIGIATGKLHARGPVGLEELTIFQYRVLGDGQTRPV